MLRRSFRHDAAPPGAGVTTLKGILPALDERVSIFIHGKNVNKDFSNLLSVENKQPIMSAIRKCVSGILCRRRGRLQPVCLVSAELTGCLGGAAERQLCGKITLKLTYSPISGRFSPWLVYFYRILFLLSLDREVNVTYNCRVLTIYNSKCSPNTFVNQSWKNIDYSVVYV